MPDYRRQPYKLLTRGVGLRHPADFLPDGLYPALNNMDVDDIGALTVRRGIGMLDGTAYAAASLIHSMRRLQDLTSSQNLLLVGAGTSLFTNGSAAAIDTGYSGSPLSFVRMRPPQSPRPWMYVGDSSRMRKVLVTGMDYPVGIAPPTSPPATTRGTPNYTVIEPFEAAGAWANSGTAGAISVAARFNTTITKILYDVGTSGWCSIVPVSAASMQTGALAILDAAGDNETVKIRKVFEAITTTTIASIIYDSGTSGLCSIVLTAQSTGLEPDAVVYIAAAEYVRVLSVSTAPDGTVSFRCSTTATRAAGDSVSGANSFRTFTVATIADTNTITGNYFQSTVTAGTGYLTLDDSGAPVNLAVINSRPVQLSDYLHISVFADKPENITSAKAILNTDTSFPADFTQLKNALYFPFTQSAFQSVANNTATPTAAQQSAIQTDIINSQAQQQAATPEQFADAVAQLNALQAYNPDVPIDINSDEFAAQYPELAIILSAVTYRTPEARARLLALNPGLQLNPSGAVVSAQVGSGASQWSELLFKVSDLVQVGTDPVRTLATMTGLILQLTVSASTVFRVDSWWIGGTYGPDTHQSVPYTIYQRYRASSSGARSNPSPPIRASMEAQRERIVITPVVSPDTQVDFIDIFAVGGRLNQPRLVLSTPNSATAVNWDSTDAANAVNEVLSFTNFQPFPVSDIPRSGTITVSGTTGTWVSGDTFNTSWQAGSQVLINNIPYTLYAPPASTTKLQFVENAGNQTAATFSIPEATIGGQPLAFIWGPDPLTGVMFGVKNTNIAGTLMWTNPNDPDSASDANTYEVTSPSEPLLGGFMYNGSSYVWSTEKLYRATAQTYTDPVSGMQSIIYRTQEVPNWKGILSPWSFAVGDRIWQVTREGIEESTGGPPTSITDETLYPLFAHGGGVGTSSVNGYYPIDFAYPERIRLSYTKDALYFSYQDTQGAIINWKYNRTIPVPGWFRNNYANVYAQTVYEDELQSSTSVLMAGRTFNGAGNLVYKLGQGTDDNGTAITWDFNTPAFDYGDPRSQKLCLDYMLDCDPKLAAITLGLYGNNLGTLIASSSIVAGSTGRQQIPKTAITSGLSLYRNFGLYVNGVTLVGSPVFYEFEPNSVIQPYVAVNFSNQYQSHKFVNYGHIRDGWIMYISTTTLTFTITVDGGTGYSFSIPSSLGLPKKLYLFDASITPPSAASFVRKGKIFLYSVVSSVPFALFTDETIINAKEWGSTGPYIPFKPFVGQTAA